MVSVDLNIKGVMSLYDSGAIDDRKAKEYLDGFDKKDFIAYMVAKEEEEDDIRNY